MSYDSIENFCRQCAIEDAEKWIKSLIVDHDIPQDVPLDDILAAAEDKYNNYANSNTNVFLAMKEPGDPEYPIEYYKDEYKRTFIRKATIYVRELRKKESAINKLKEKLKLQARAEAALWFAGVMDAEFLTGTTRKEVENVGRIRFALLHDTGEDKALQAAFIDTFTEEAISLLATIDHAVQE